jgi:hypothetical protein
MANRRASSSCGAGHDDAVQHIVEEMMVEEG